MLVRMQAIGKAFYGKPVLQSVSFDLRPGEIHVLAGENGAGKSTLMKILSGVYTQYEGMVSVSGRQVRFRSTHDAARHGIAMIHQELSLVPSLPVLDNIHLGREPRRPWLRRDDEADRAREVLKQMGLDIPLDTLVEDLPLALRQMVEIAKALVNDARILIMDEPTSALGEQETCRLFALIDGLKARGCGIVFISHRMQEVYRIADRITVLRDGAHVGTDVAAELSEGALIQRMVGRELSQQFPPREPVDGDAVLTVSNVWVRDPSEPSAWVVIDVSFSVASGEILGIAGLQGSGRSELLAGLFGVHGRLPRGTVAVDGGAVRLSSPREAIRHGLAFLTNDRKRDGLVLSQSVQANVSRAAFRRFSPWGWVRPAQERAAAAEARDQMSIAAASLDQSARELSGGNQQKVVLAHWLETRPRVLLLDEPTRGVDVGAKHEIYELMNRCTARGMAIVLITSEMPELLAMADRILVLHRGRSTALFGRDEATQERIVHAAMGAGEEDARPRLPKRGSPEWRY